MKLHIDIDCFFVSAERTINPNYKRIPLAVGGRSNLSIFYNQKQKRDISKIEGAFTSSLLSVVNDKSFNSYFKDDKNKVRGIITTASYEARSYGVKTAMSVAQALKLCPHLKVIPPNYSLYHRLSYEIKTFLEKNIPQIEQFSIDEYFGDVSGWIEEKEIIEFSHHLKQQILQRFDIPVSIGIAESKWMAKFMTEFAKPHGVKKIKQNEIATFIENINVKEFPGIGKGYQQKLLQYTIRTLGDVSRNKKLLYNWGKPGIQLYNRVTGIEREALKLPKKKKSLGIGRTFDPIKNRTEIKRRVVILCRYISFIALKNSYCPFQYGLKIRYSNRQKSKKYVNVDYIFNELSLKNELLKLFDKLDILPYMGVIQINITLSHFQSKKKITVDIFSHKENYKKTNLMKSVHKLRNKYGIDIIKSAGELK